MNAPVRQFVATDASQGEEHVSVGIVGPPFGGKTRSSLRIAKGMQDVRGGDIVLIDTEGGRARKHAQAVAFKHVEFTPPFRSGDFLDAIKQQVNLRPAAIIVDSLSDEHEGEGGYLEWHDEMVPKMGNNEWAAWSKPKAARKRLITGLLQIKVPLIFTFRAREKTKQEVVNGKKVVTNIGWQPVAPLEIVHSLDLTCILPPHANGVPVWKSDKIGEDFIIKLPDYLAPLIKQGAQLTEELGRALAQWAAGTISPPPTIQSASAAGPAASSAGLGVDGAADVDDEFEVSVMDLDQALGAAAKLGTPALVEAWGKVPNEHRATLKTALDRRHKPTALEVDQVKSRAK